MTSQAGIGHTSSLLRITDVSKAYGGTQALAGVSLEVARGSIHALLGGNGSGKSTLIKILAGVVAADAGELQLGGVVQDARSQTPARARACGLHFVHQQSSTFPDLSIAENIAIGRGYETGVGGRVKWSALKRRAREVMRRFDLDQDPDTLVGDLGPAMQMMVAIARALQGQEGAHDGVLVLDEPTASLPRHEVALLLSALERYARAGQTIMYVSHRLDEVMAVAHRATVLQNGHVVATRERDELDEDTLAALIVGRAVDAAADRSVGEPGAVVLEARGLTRDGRAIQVHGGEVVGLAGLLGSGRTTLLRSLFGEVPATGDVRVDGHPVRLGDTRRAMRAGFAYIPEDRPADAAFADLSVRENISIAALSTYWKRLHIRRRAERDETRRLMRAFGVRAASDESPLASLSGGNQQKVILARWLQRAPRVLLLDEPTQGVDVGARAEIHALIREVVDAGAAALLVTSDFRELASVCDRAIVMQHGCVTAELTRADLQEEALNIAVYAGRPES
ncbi:MAG: transporter related protein [Conexibacter sp.]|nr:transporter related protein [Conexibacter sp.]